MGMKGPFSEVCSVLIIIKQTTDTAVDIQQPAMAPKAGQKVEASWEVHSKEVKIVRGAIRYGMSVLRII
jgi:hypothetical protein